MRKARKRPVTIWLLSCLQFLMGIGSLASGPLLFLAPDGRLTSWSVEMLEGTPFTDYLVPGIILFLFLGVYPVFVGYALLAQPGWRQLNVINPFKGYHWSWSASWAAGVIILIWIIVELALLGYISLLQPLVVVWGTILIVLTLLPATRRYSRSVGRGSGET